MNMIERVARAMYDATPFKETEGGYDEQSETYRRMCELLARAAIEAMREPTDAMLYDMDGYSDLVGPYPEANTKEERLREFRGAYQAAIDKALEA